ncbi:hypothetical protein [Bacillus sp. AFS037270]|uniref:hypothetical protein n=1 Tax=Bacillus sp. AFS037270 TaxID=2033499 RepID=UPI000BFD84D2|nr:hypothetical protein [Bacillus sp. AFS037270]PGV47832.1 hypothetical protein COD92_28295 [Bacillus sp. AFS037270]
MKLIVEISRGNSVDDINNEEVKASISEEILKVISDVMKDSYLENNFKGSSTRPELLIDTSNKLFEKFAESNLI